MAELLAIQGAYLLGTKLDNTKPETETTLSKSSLNICQEGNAKS